MITHEEAIKLTTHKEAIKTLKSILANTGWLTKIAENSIKYSINQLEQCEVYNEPVEMEVKRSHSQRFFKAKVMAKIKGEYLVLKKMTDDLYFTNIFRPIKKEPLEFIDWLEDNRTDESFVIGSYALREKHNEWKEYLKQFEQDNK